MNRTKLLINTSIHTSLEEPQGAVTPSLKSNLKTKDMNREIKFRAWSRIRKQWLQDGLSTVLMIDLEGGLNYVQTDSCESPFRDVDDFVLCQFTGLHDKNGKEIYEGDICSIILNGENSHLVHQMGGVRQVYFDTQYFSYYFEGFVPIVWGGFESIEVIGNIYENPELLK